MRIQIVFITILIVCCFSYLQAQVIEHNPVRLSTSKDSYSIGKSVYIYEDQTATLDFAQILEPSYQEKFKRSKEESINFGVTSSAIWLRFELQNKDFDKLREWILSLNYPLCDYVKLYFKNKEGNWQVYLAGDGIAQSRWEIPSRNFLFPIRFEDDAVHTYYMYFATSGSMQINLSLQTPMKFSEVESDSELGYGMFYGILLIAVFYNLFIYISFREKNYLFYVCYVLASILVQSSFSGHLNYYLLGWSPYLANIAVPASMAMGNITVPLFTISFLQVKKFISYMYYLLWVMIWSNSIIFILSFFINVRYAIIFSGAWATMTPFIIIYTAIICYQKGHKETRFFLIAWIFFMIGLLLTSLRNFGLLEANFWTIHGLKIGLICEVSLISLALADRYNIIRKEALRVEREANENLERKVIERTAQLKQSNQKLEQQKQEITQQSEELKASNERLIEMDEFKQNLTGMIVHDLKNPLNAILNIPKSMEKEDIWKAVHNYGHQMLHLVLNILEVQQLEEAKMEIQKDLYHLEDLLNEAINQVNFMSEQKNISIHIISSSKVDIKVDSNLITRVIINLLTNAIKYSSQNSTIVIRVEKEDEDVNISIIDEGQGIESQYIDQIFHKFVKVAPKSFDKNRSTGLGLTFCKMAVEVHGGEIGVRSIYGEGTTFWFKLPVYEWIENNANHPDSEVAQASPNRLDKPIPKIKLLPAEQQYILKNHVHKLQELDVYFRSEIQDILKEINDQSTEVNEWKLEVQKAVTTVNEPLYKSLLDLVVEEGR